ncbi:hypothetical protein LTR27_009496 [Elasticomyces elasticus]|nr:hypothetical protein LTR27_009496 [Elasticomyces elasticus]
MSNAMPRTNLDAWKGKLPETLWCQLARARGAHINSMEVFPLFAAAVVSLHPHSSAKGTADKYPQLAGNATKLPAEDLNTMALTFLGARALYMACYMTIKSDVVAYARTGVYAWSIGLPLMTLWRAGQKSSV